MSHSKLSIRFSLTTFLIVIAMISVLVCLWTRLYWEKQHAINTIDQSGGQVWSHNDFNVGRKSSRATWWKSFFGDRFSLQAEVVDFSNIETATNIADKTVHRETVIAISKLTSVKVVRFYEVQLRLQDLPLLGSLTNLTGLQFVCNCGSTPHEVSYIASLQEFRNLKSLIVTDLPDVAGELGFLAKLKELSYLHLEADKIGAKDLQSISKLNNLECLILKGLQDSHSFAYLTALENLSLLDTGSTPVSTSDLKFIARLKNIQSLSLWPMVIDDGFVASLGLFKKLQYLELKKLEVTNEELNHLQKSLQNCTVSIAQP